MNDSTTLRVPVAEVTARTMLDCSAIDINYAIAPSIISSCCAVFGIMYTFLGYRFFKATMFTTGLVLGSSLTYIVCVEEALLPLIGKIGVSVSAGVLCGLIALLVAHVGLAMTGLILGGLLGAAAMVILQQFQPPHTKWIPIGTLFGAGLVTALLALYFRRSLTIAGTSMLGAAMIAAAVDYFSEQLRLAHYVWDCIKAQPVSELCWYSWVILSLWPVLFLMGTIIQCTITGKDTRQHQAVPVPSHKRQNVNLERVRARDQAREKQRTQQPPPTGTLNRYRHLYQIRRSNGDVISRSYIENIHNKLSPTLRNITKVSGSGEPSIDSEQTHITRLP